MRAVRCVPLPRAAHQSGNWLRSRRGLEGAVSLQIPSSAIKAREMIAKRIIELGRQGEHEYEPGCINFFTVTAKPRQQENRRRILTQANALSRALSKLAKVELST